MGILNSQNDLVVEKPTKLTKPFFYKADSDAKNQLQKLNEILKTAPSGVKSKIEQDIKILSYGIIGEENVAFELNNSYMPIIVLHDLYILFEGFSAQIDYLVITRKFTLFIECKNLFGNIEVNSNGDFIRTIEYKGKYKKEGTYSPITQNERHLELIKTIGLSKRNNRISKALFLKFFNDFNKSVIVLANPKTIINMTKAKMDVKEKIIRSDQLITYIKKLYKESDLAEKSDKEMYEYAEAFLSKNSQNTVDYTKKYFIEENVINEIKEEQPKEIISNIEENPIYKALKQYRYEISKAEKVKAYFIFNNAQMEDLISVRPKNLGEMKNISGFGEIKCQKYGNSILEIFKKNTN